MAASSTNIHGNENISDHMPSTVTTTKVSTKRALDVNVLNDPASSDNVNLAQVAGTATAVGNGPVTNGVQRVAEAGGTLEGTNDTDAARLNVPDTWTTVYTTGGDRKNQLGWINMDASNWGEIRVGTSGDGVEMPPNGTSGQFLVDVTAATPIQVKAQVGGTTLSRVVIYVA